MIERQVVAPLRAERPAEIDVAAGLASRIAQRCEQDERPPLVGQRVLAAAEPQAGAAEFIVRAGLRRRVLDPLGRRQRGALDVGPVLPVRIG